MIIILFKLIFLTSLLVLGYTIITQEGMGLYFIREWAEKKVEEGKKWIEPILLCHWCQSSTWSLFGFAFAYGLGIISLEWRLILLYPLCVCGSSLLCGLIWSTHQMCDSIKDKNDAEMEAMYEPYEEHEDIFENQHN